jgi:hypothetical protein
LMQEGRDNGQQRNCDSRISNEPPPTTHSQKCFRHISQRISREASILRWKMSKKDLRPWNQRGRFFAVGIKR